MPDFNINIKDVNSLFTSGQELEYNAELQPQEINLPSSIYDQGYIYNPSDPYGSISKHRADVQPWAHQVGASLGQAANEAIFGTVQSFAAIGDLPSYAALANDSEKSDIDFHNAVYDWTKNTKESINKEIPIYSGDRFDSGWFWQNLGQTLGSAASFYIPGMAGAKLLGKLGEAVKLGTTASRTLQTLGSAAIMRHAENFQEASNVYDLTLESAYKKLKTDHPEWSEEQLENESHRYAGEAAASDYKMNSANYVFDVLQMGAILKPKLGVSLGLVERQPYKVLKASNLLPENKIARLGKWIADPAKGILEAGSEGLEEIVNQISQFEAQRESNIKLGVIKDDGSDFMDRLGKYLGDEEVQDSFIWGMVGGAAFKGLALATGQDENKNIVKNKLTELSQRPETIRNYNTKISEINNNTNLSQEEKNYKINNLKSGLGFDLGVNAERVGNTDILLQQLNQKEFQDKFVEDGIITEQDLQKEIPKLKRSIEQGAYTYKKYADKLFESNISETAKNVLIDQAVEYSKKLGENLEDLNTLKTQYSNILSKDPVVISKMSDPDFVPSVQFTALNLAKAQIKNNIELKDIDIDNKEIQNKLLKNLEEKEKEVSSELFNPKYTVNELSENLAQQYIYEAANKVINDNLEQVTSKKNIAEAEKLVKDISKNIGKKVSENVEEADANIKEEELNEFEKQMLEEEEFVIPDEEITADKDIKENIEEAKPTKNIKEELEKEIKPKKRGRKKDWFKAVNNAKNGEQLNEIYDKADSVNEVTPELVQAISIKRESVPETGVKKEVKEYVNNEKKSKVTIDKEEYTSDTNNKVTESFEVTKTIISESNTGKTLDVDGNIVTEDYKKISNGHNALAHLSRNFIRFTSGSVTYTSDISNELAGDESKAILDPEFVKTGDNVEFRIADDNNIDVYEDAVKKKVTSWGSKKIGLTQQQFNNNVPIRVYKDNVLIGYLHDVDWITSENVFGNIEEDKKKLSEIRNYIIKNNGFNTKIIEKTSGYLLLEKDNKSMFLSQSVGTASNYTLGVFNGVDIKIGKGSANIFTDELINKKELIPGATYMIVKLPNRSNVALGLNNVKVINSIYKEEIKETVNSLIELYIKRNNDELQKKIISSLGNTYDPYSFMGLKKLLTPFLYSYNTGNRTLKEIYKNIPNGNSTFSMSQNSIEVGNIFVNPIKPEKLEDVLEKINKIIDNKYLPTDINKWEENSNFIFIKDGNVELKNYKEFLSNSLTTNVLGVKIKEEEGKDIYTWSVQPVVRFDFSEIFPKEISEDIIREEEIKLTEKTIETKDLDLALDINEEFLLPSSIVNVEDQMKDFVKTILSEKLTFKIQESIVEHFTTLVTRKAFKDRNPDVKKIRDDVFNEYKNKIEGDLIKIREANNPEKYVKLANLYSNILEDWDLLTRLSNIRIAEINEIKDIDNFLTDDYIDEDTNQENEKLDYNKTNYEKTIKPSVLLKRFLSDITLESKNIFNENNVMNGKDAWDKINQWTVNLAPNYESIIIALKAESKYNTWVNQVIDKLEKSGEELRNTFISAVTNNSVNHYKVMWDNRTNKNGELVKSSINIELDNRASTRDEIKNRWISNLKDTPIVIAGEDDQHYLDKNAISKLNSDYLELVKNSDPTKAREWLETIGIDVSDNTWNKLTDGTLYWDGKNRSLEELIKSRNFIFYIANESFKNYKEQDSIDNIYPLENQAILNKFVNLEARYTDKPSSVTHRSAGKTVSSIGKNNYITNIINTLVSEEVSGKDSLRKRLLEDTFRSYNYLLNNLNKPEQYKNLEYGVASLEAVKKHGVPGKDNKQLHNLNPDEIEVVKLGLLLSSIPDNSGLDKRVVVNLFPTQSDKTTAFLMKSLAAKVKFNDDGSLSRESLEFLYEQAVLPEIARIKKYQNTTVEALNTNKQFKAGGNKFLIFPSIANIEGIFNKNTGKLADKVEINFKDKIINEINNVFSNLVNEKLDKWNEYNIIKEGKLQYGLDRLDVLEKNQILYSEAHKDIIPKIVASDMIYQNMIAIINSYAIFIGDPALYFKKDAPTTFDMLGKRLAGIISPATEITNADTNVYNQLFAADRALNSKYLKQYTDLLSKEDSKAYSKDGMLSEATNAQEFTTLLEHLYIENNMGLLPDGFYTLIEKNIKGKSKYNISDIIKDNKEYTDFWNTYKLQVQKPRYFYHRWNDALKMMEIVYIKSSSYPLTPELTKGLKIDKLRKYLEENGIDRIAFSSGIKVGNFSNPVDIWNEDGTIKELTPDELKSSVKQLERRGWGIQQENPLKLSDVINRISQADKNLFTDMGELTGFSYKGKLWTGNELKEEWNKEYKKLYEIAKNKLNEEIIQEDGALDKEKLRKIIIEEMISRDYDITDIEAVKLDKDLRFLAFNPLSSKFEALLNSIVKNRILKLKFRGTSNVLSTQEGFEFSEDFKYTDKGIIFTDSFDGELKPARLENDIVKPAQIIVPFKFYDNEGNKLKLSDFSNNGKIDYNKLPKELLQGLAARIPNQGPNSQSWFEIVGFLPENMGDIVIAPREYLAQMGSDFDVDKLYSYLYNTYQKKDGSLIRLKDDGSDKAIQNRLLDIRIAIHSNPSKEVQKLIVKPIGFWEFKDAADELRNLKDEGVFTSLSDQYQETKRFNATQGKSGVGVFSNLSMFYSLIQGKGLYFYKLNKKGEKIPEVLTFGDNDGSTLGELKTLDEKDYISQVIAGLQSAAVDNEKEQILDVLGLNSNTFMYANLMALMGFSQELKYFLNQPIIVDYINKTRISTLDKFNPDITKEAKSYVMSKYQLNDIDQFVYDKYKDGKGLSIKNLKNSLKDQSNPEFKYIQLAAIEQLESMESRAKFLNKIMAAINTDSRGLGKNLFETLAKEETIINLDRRNNLSGFESILGNLNNPTTIQGFATVNGLFYNNELWKAFFPYTNQDIKLAYETIERILGKDNEVVDSEFRKNIFDEIKSYLFTRKDLGIFDGDIEEERNRILKGNKSLAKITKIMQKDDRFRNNPFVGKLLASPNKTSMLSEIFINASYDHTNETSMRLAFISLYTEPKEIFNGYTTRDYFKDLLKYAYLTGGVQKARQFIRYIPQAYLHAIPFASKLSDIVDSSNIENLDMSIDRNYFDLSNFIIQYLQNNPDKIKKVTNKDVIFNKDKTEFYLTNKDLLVMRNNEDNMAPEVLSIVADNRIRPYNKNLIYIYTGESNEKGPRYTQIDNLSFGDFSQYNANLSHGSLEKSIISTYNSNTERTLKTSRFPEDKQDADEETYENEESLSKKEVKDILGIKNGDSKILQGIIENIALNTTNPFYEELAKVIAKNPQHLKELKVSTELTKSRGAFTKNTIFINNNNIDNNTINGSSQTILHESLHGIMNKYIKQYESDKSKLDPKAKEALDSLYQSFNRYKSSVNQEKLQDLISKLKDSDFDNITTDELSEYYGATKLTEFISMLMTDQKFQKILNNLEATTTGKPWFEVFLDKLKKFFEALGFPINTNSVLAASIDDVLTIIENKNVEEVISSEETLLPSIKKQEEIKYTLRLINSLQKLQRNKFESSKLQGWINDLQKQGVPKEQINMFKESTKNGMTKEEIIASIAVNYSYTVESNIQKSTKFTTSNQSGQVYEDPEYAIDAIYKELDKEDKLEPGSNEYMDEVERRLNKRNLPTSYYSNLTVPGGTNYTENEIRTPDITPSIKGHAQFSTDQGIGWFRSDEKGEEVISPNIPTDKELLEDYNKGYDGKPYPFSFEEHKEMVLSNLNSTTQYKPSKTRRILELQSDLFQKGRDKEKLVGKEEDEDRIAYLESIIDRSSSISYTEEGSPVLTKNIEKELTDLKEIKNKSQNQFLQLLNKDNNWVTFFIKSIIQDSAKKGYEKVLFPKGETAAKIEGHETLAYQIKKINEAIENPNKYFSRDDPESEGSYSLYNWDGQHQGVINVTGYTKKEFVDNLEHKKIELKSQGIEKLKPIEAFYEIKVGNILEKQFGKDNVKTITDEYGNQWREIDLSNEKVKLETEEILLLPSTKKEILKKYNEINSDGRQKVLLITDENYKAMLNRCKKINQAKEIYKATVGTTVGEDVGINNKRLYYYVKLDRRSEEDISARDRIALVTDQEVNDRIRFCRGK